MFTPRSVLAVTVVVAVSVGLTVGGIGAERWVHAADQVAAARTRQIDRVDQHRDLLADIRLASRHDERVAANAVAAGSGRTLTADPIRDVLDAVSGLRQAERLTNHTAGRMAGALREALSGLDRSSWWPPSGLRRLASIDTDLSSAAWFTWHERVAATIANVTAAELAWQAENERIAADQRAAAEAARQSQPPTGSFGPSEGVAAPAGPLAPATAGLKERVEAFIRTYAPQVTFSWEPGSCSTDVICGVTLVGGDTPSIRLDPNLGDAYLSSAGAYVLVHEAAHARSWYRYGSLDQLISTSTDLMTNGLSGIPAVEWMADCATIVRLGYSLGTYTSSCTDAQYAEAATYWG